MSKREFRTAGTSTVSGNTLTGYIARFNELSEDLGGFKEKLAPGCFSSSLKNDIRALINHDTNLVVGRTTSGTLKLSEDAVGLAFSIDLPDTTAARDLKVSVERGDLTGCSFGFICTKDEWNGSIRTVLDTQLFETSIGVCFPAYESTSMALRTLFPDGSPMPPVGKSCKCSCGQCVADACGLCSNDDCDDSCCADGGCTNQGDDSDDGSDDSDIDSSEFNNWHRDLELRLIQAQLRAKINH